MYDVRQHPNFVKWISSIKDQTVRLRLYARLRKLEMGVFGDCKPVGGGVSELREHFGAGWRMYYVQRGAVVVVMLGGGSKSSQQKDIEKAQALAETLTGE